MKHGLLAALMKPRSQLARPTWQNGSSILGGRWIFRCFAERGSGLLPLDGICQRSALAQRVRVRDRIAGLCVPRYAGSGGGQPGDCCYYGCARQLDRQCPAGDCQRRWKLFYFQPFCRMSGQSCDVSGGCVKLSCSVCLPLCGISSSSAARISDRMPCHAGRVSAPCRNGCAAERR